jgi:hypothetical protein
MTNWQPIETAPKDGTDVLCWHSRVGAMVLSFWDGNWREKANCLALRDPPLLWMPLPEPPKDKP